MSVIGELLVEINGDNSGLKKSLGDSSNAVTSGVGKMVSAIGLASLAWKGVDLAMQGIDYNKAAEQAEIAFGVFLGSSSAAVDMIEKMRDLAKETPLEFADVRDAGLKLQAFGVATEKIIPSMRMLSDVSAGLQIPIKDLAYLFGSVQAQGKALTVDLMQFANRGIPIWTELAKVTGVQGAALKKMVEEGKIGFPQVEQAFRNMTSEGGKFFNMAVKQMDSLAGSQSNLNDAFDVFLGQLTKGATGPIKDANNGLAKMLGAIVDLSKQLEKNGKNMWTAVFDPVSLIKASTQVKNINTGLEETKKRGDAAMGDFRQSIKESAEEAKKAKEEIAKTIEEAKARSTVEEAIKQEYSDQIGFIARIIQSSKDLTAIEQQAAKAKEISDAKEATGRQIVLGYQNAAINAQIKAIGLEKNYQDEIEKTAKLYKDIEDSLKYAGTQFSSLASSIAKFGNDELSKLVSGFADIANNAGNLVAALGKGDYVAAAVSGIALIADAWSMFFKDNSEEERKANEERKKAEAERISAVKALEKEYQAKFDSDLVRLEKERNERVAYARKIGADILQIESYYAGEIEKVKRTTADISVESGRVEAEKNKIIASYKPLIEEAAIQQALIWNPQASEAFIREFASKNPMWLSEQISFLVAKTGENAVKSINQMMQEELGQVVYNLQLFEERAQGATQGIGQSLVEGLKSGASLGDFRKTIMDMLRNMAIEAAVIAGGFQEKFKEIGVMIAEALKDGFSETELAAIDLRVNALYSQATNAINPLNDLFNRAANAQNITNGGGTTINITTTNDPLTIANALGNVQQSLAYQGVVA